jgi:hypothetical protein
MRRPFLIFEVWEKTFFHCFGASHLQNSSKVSLVYIIDTSHSWLFSKETCSHTLCRLLNLAETKQVGLGPVRFISASIDHPRICLEQRRLRLGEHLGSTSTQNYIGDVGHPTSVDSEPESSLHRGVLSHAQVQVKNG